MFKTYQLIGILILVIGVPICLFAKPAEDTTTYISNINGKEIKGTSSNFIAKRWKEGEFWHVKNYTFQPKVLQFDGYFDDLDCTKKEGIFLSYYPDGMRKDSGEYLQNKKQGMHYGWYETGERSFINHYKDDFFVDTSIAWHKNGKKSMLTIADAEGSGLQEQYHNNGKIRAKGNYHLGKKNGIWTFTDRNQIVSQKINYESDSAITVTNYNENGIEEEGISQKGKKLVEIPASFPDGMNGWRRFLEKNLRYPEAAQHNKAQGVIRISLIVDEDGNVTDYKILGNPDKDLAKEALRIMSISPKWIPALQNNRRVTYRFIQTITFQLS